MFSLFDLLGPILRRGSSVFLIFIAFLLAPTSDATAALSATKVTADSTKIYFTIPYTKTPKWVRVHIDADRNASTGYSFGNIGSGWMLQNGQLYQYTGSGGANWSWRMVKEVSYSVANGVARFTINRSDIGNPAGVTLISETDPPVRRSGTISLTLPVVLSNTTTSPTISPTTSATSTTGAATAVTADSTKIYFTIPYTQAPNWVRVHIDADRNASTGYSFGNIGSGWMLQNGQLYQYTGNGGYNWSWRMVKEVSYSVANGVARFTINRSDIGNPPGITLISETDPPVLRSGTISLTLPVVLSNTPTEPTPTPTEPTPTPTEPTPTPTEPTPTPTEPTPTPTEPTPTPTPPAC